MMPGVALVDAHDVAIGVEDERHLADGRGERLPLEADASRLELRDGRVEVLDLERHAQQPSEVGAQPGATPSESVPEPMSYSVHCIPPGSPWTIVGLSPSTFS